MLLKLSHPVAISTKVQPVRLPDPRNKDYVYEPAFVSGWGIHNRRDGPSGNLKAAELTVCTDISIFPGLISG